MYNAIIFAQLIKLCCPFRTIIYQDAFSYTEPTYDCLPKTLQQSLHRDQPLPWPPTILNNGQDH
jgi:hypothetical protein